MTTTLTAETARYALLLVEPDPLLQQSLVDLFDEQGLEVTAVKGLHAATQLLHEKKDFDLFVIDQELPDGQGIELVKLLPQPEEPTLKIPVILLAAQEDQGLLRQCFELGINDYLIKPINPQRLSLKARSLLNKVCLSRRVIEQKAEVERLLDLSNREAEMASYVFYNNLLDHVSDTIRGFNRYLNASSDFCGDLILAKTSPSGSTFILHADAMGHGLSATMTLLPLVDVFHGMVSKGYALSMIVREMNRKLHFKLPPDRFVAASLVELDVLHDQVGIWNGGMPTLYHLDEEGRVIDSFPSKNMALGILDNLSFNAEVERFQLTAAGGLFGCSDGLTEQVNALDEFYGIHRLLSVLAGASRHSLISSLIAELKEFSGVPRFDDDVSLFYVHFPELIYFQHQQYQAQASLAHLLEIDSFTWEIKLSGRQLTHQEIPALCNDYLQDMGFPQPFCQRAFTVISELANNAIEHGLLDLESSIKDEGEGFAEYYVQREQRLRSLTSDNWLRVKLDWDVDRRPSAMFLEIEHNGKGFDVQKVITRADDGLSGRGLLLVKKLASALHYTKGGCFVIATLE